MQIKMKSILTMYREMEDSLMEAVNLMGDELRQKIIMNKALEKKYNFLLHEISTCIFKTSDLLRLIIKETVVYKKYMRQLDSIRWVSLYTDQGDGTSDKHGVQAILDLVRNMYYKDAKIYT